jgi:hypothetical protein
MIRSSLFWMSAAMCAIISRADVVDLIEYNSIHIPITPFSNMASGYQATNPGFRAIIRSNGGEFVAGGPLTIDSVIRGTSDDASSGSAYGKLIMRVDMEESYPGVSSGLMNGTYKGTLDICMAQDPDSSIQSTQCKNLSGNIHPERPFQWLKKAIDFKVEDGNVTITKYYGSVGEGGTSQQLSLAVFHPAYGFAAPGKAFKDYQSPLVLDLDHNNQLDLVNVWDESAKVRFDLNGTNTKVRTGWVQPKDGLLFWDNGSGCVSNGTEFFGEYTGSTDGNRTFENGFKALSAKLDPKNTGKIVAKNFPQLKIWRDAGKDGVCKKSEVVAASKLVKEINVAYNTVENVKLNEDNEVRLTGSYVGVDGKSHLIGDVWFKQRRNEVANNR